MRYRVIVSDGGFPAHFDFDEEKPARLVYDIAKASGRVSFAQYCEIVEKLQPVEQWSKEDDE